MVWFNSVHFDIVVFGCIAIYQQNYTELIEFCFYVSIFTQSKFNIAIALQKKKEKNRKQ